jgi:hypothetical protein
MGLCRAVLVVAIVSGCANPGFDDPPPVIHARFDPDNKAIPMPNDAVRDAELGVLDLPNDTEKELARLTDAEKEFYAYLETLDAWSSLMSATVELTGSVDPKSIDAENLQVWRWTGSPTPVDTARISISEDGKKLTVDPPREGWAKGDRYVVMLRGGPLGARGFGGERVECDAAFYFLRQTQKLDVPEHERAFPGDTRAERMENAEKLEKIRTDLVPVFDFFESRGVPRSEVASLWAFTVTKRTELAMDKASQRMPLPINLMLDPKTGHVHVPAAPWDRPFEAAAKARLSDFTGFGLSSAPLLEFTAPMTRATVTASTIKLFELGDTPKQIEAEIELMPDLMHVIVKPKQQRFAESTSYMVVVDDGVRDAAGKKVVTMPAGHFLKAKTQVIVDGVSQVKAVEAEDAEKLERARTQIAAAIDMVGRDRVLGAWPFTTMPVKQPLVEWRQKAEATGAATAPTVTSTQSPGDAVADFPLGVTALTNVANVYHGTIQSPFYLDARTTALRGDAGFEMQDVAFTLTTPKNPKPGPMPVVIFGHGLVTERRFVLAVASSLASKGYAAVAIDFPYHGTRTYCAKGGPISVINPQTGEALSLEPCGSGTTCNDYGKCVDAAGQGNKLAKWPIIDLAIASGAVFTDVNHIASTKDHFLQALVDLGALDRSLRKGDWSPLLGRAVDTSKIFYTGQSLGGIMGAVFLGTSPDISRAVLNVPGADLIRMFDESTFFSSHLDGLFIREGVDKDDFEGRRLLEVAKWIMDAVDPQHLGAETGARALLLQMATLDFIIPNDSTKELEAVTKAPRRDYIAEHGFITIPLEPEYYRGVADMAKWLAGEAF